jgi:hypothetical protein
MVIEFVPVMVIVVLVPSFQNTTASTPAARRHFLGQNQIELMVGVVTSKGNAYRDIGRAYYFLRDAI